MQLYSYPPTSTKFGRKSEDVRFLRLFPNIIERIAICYDMLRLLPVRYVRNGRYIDICIYTYKHGGLYKLTHFVRTIIIVNDKTIDSYCSYCRRAVDKSAMREEPAGGSVPTLLYPYMLLKILRY